MASNTASSENRRKNRHKNMGRKRKNAEGRKSTKTDAELFAALGEPGKPAPKGAAAAAPKAAPKAAAPKAAAPKAAAKTKAAK